MDVYSSNFITALETNDILSLMKVPKAERHTHVGFNGNKEFLFGKTGKMIYPVEEILKSMDDMHKWISDNIGNTFDGLSGEKILVDACFQQAEADGITEIFAGENVCTNDEIFGGNIKFLIDTFFNAKEKYSPDIRFNFQMGFLRHFRADYLLKCAEPFWEQDCFDSIDLYGDELAQPIENFIPIYRKAKQKGLILRAHVGEWGSADDVMRAVETLELDEVQHGIAAAESGQIMKFLADNRIRLNICPASNVKLGRVEELKKHPIRKLYDSGIKVTVNSDDMLVFGNSVSQEFMDLFRCRLFTADELNIIRLNGFS